MQVLDRATDKDSSGSPAVPHGMLRRAEHPVPVAPPSHRQEIRREPRASVRGRPRPPGPRGRVRPAKHLRRALLRGWQSQQQRRPTAQLYRGGEALPLLQRDGGHDVPARGRLQLLQDLLEQLAEARLGARRVERSRRLPRVAARVSAGLLRDRRLLPAQALRAEPLQDRAAVPAEQQLHRHHPVQGSELQRGHEVRPAPAEADEGERQVELHRQEKPCVLV